MKLGMIVRQLQQQNLNVTTWHGKHIRESNRDSRGLLRCVRRFVGAEMLPSVEFSVGLPPYHLPRLTVVVLTIDLAESH